MTEEAKPAPQQPNKEVSPSECSRVQAVWVESELPESMYFFDAKGQVIKPSKNTYYPPVGPVVYDREGHPFVSVHPEAKSTLQTIQQALTNFEQKHMKPLVNDMQEAINEYREEKKRVEEQNEKEQKEFQQTKEELQP